MTAPAMRTLRVSLADLELIPAGPGGTITGDVWAQLTQQVRTTAGQIIGLVPIRRAVGAFGIVDFHVPANDDAGIHADDQGFGVVVGWDLVARDARGVRTDVTGPGVTVHVTSASPSVIAFPTDQAVVPPDDSVYGSPYGAPYGATI